MIFCSVLLEFRPKRYRLDRNLSQEALANIGGIEFSQVSRVERGIINTGVSVTFALLRHLKLNPGSYLIPLS
jgi:transcriptional regulator with XRE-family HTH domain